MSDAHKRRVAAHAEMARLTLDALIAKDVRPRNHACLEGLALVDAWVAGRRVTQHALRRKAQQLRRASERLGASTDAGKTAWSCACYAVGDLCAFVIEHEHDELYKRRILDNCYYGLLALSAKTPRQERAVRARLSKRRDAVMRSRTPLSPKIWVHAPEDGLASEVSDPEEMPLDHLGVKPLGAVLAARMRAVGGYVNPQSRGSEAELRRALAEQGHKLYKPILEFERHYGGIVLPERDAPDAGIWRLGPLAAASDGFKTLRGPILVPIITGGDHVAYMGARGAVWGQNHVVDASPRPFAPTGDAAVARTVLLDMLRQHRHEGRNIRILQGRNGARLARKLGLSPIRKANDAHFRAWADARRMVLQQVSDDGAVTTTLAGSGTARAR